MSETNIKVRTVLGFCFLLISIYVVLLAVILGLAMIVAVFLHWIWPQVDLGFWIIASLIGTVFTIHLLVRAIQFIDKKRAEDAELAEDEVWVFPDYLPHLRRRPRKKRD